MINPWLQDLTEKFSQVGEESSKNYEVSIFYRSYLTNRGSGVVSTVQSYYFCLRRRRFRQENLRIEF
jgi:hypothetical protein